MGINAKNRENHCKNNNKRYQFTLYRVINYSQINYIIKAISEIYFRVAVFEAEPIKICGDKNVRIIQ